MRWARLALRIFLCRFLEGPFKGDLPKALVSLRVIPDQQVSAYSDKISRKSATVTWPSPVMSAVQLAVHPNSDKATRMSDTPTDKSPSRSPGQAQGSQLPSSNTALDSKLHAVLSVHPGTQVPSMFWSNHVRRAWIQSRKNCTSSS